MTDTEIEQLLADPTWFSTDRRLLCELLERAKQAEAARVVAEADADQLYPRLVYYATNKGFRDWDHQQVTTEALAAHERAVTQRNQPA